ncbi:hypothetical protein CBR_g58400 [Chara braunii]|uniref:J domain-containing protein n=1 Tax=Chara braunii TaxID=69332 RepID=A0A388MEY5_CHABU|nr:hypothetical protein CBR_g58400 [Chara braunii]|eukprot:GBG93045.1 hypothetical protein CBR_g58400 [Chara braunii]
MGEVRSGDRSLGPASVTAERSSRRGSREDVERDVERKRRRRREEKKSHIDRERERRSRKRKSSSRSRRRKTKSHASARSSDSASDSSLSSRSECTSSTSSAAAASQPSSSSSSSDDSSPEDKLVETGTRNTGVPLVPGNSRRSLDRDEDPREVLSQVIGRFPQAAADLSVLLANIHKGQAVDISALPDARLGCALERLFVSLGMKRKSKLPGVYYHRTRASMMVRDEKLFEDLRAACRNDGWAGAKEEGGGGEKHKENGSRRDRLCAPQVGAGPSTSKRRMEEAMRRPEGTTDGSSQGSKAAGSGKSMVMNDECIHDHDDYIQFARKRRDGRDTENTGNVPQQHVRASVAAAAARSSTRCIAAEDAPDLHAHRSDEGKGRDDDASAVVFQGPSLPADVASVDGRDPDSRVDRTAEDGTKRTAEGVVDEIGPAERPAAPDHTKKRAIGPAMPPAAVLEAAARLTEASEALQAELDEGPLIGPAPPAAVKEAENATEEERFSEVVRIMSSESNQYELLGVASDASATEIKKKYWKLSLLIHPDKCAHPKAQEAFALLNKTHLDLQDPAKRAAIDKKIDEQRSREEFQAELKRLREAAQWRKVRGEALPGDARLLGERSGAQAGDEALDRDSWMTELPPERSAGYVPTQSTFFSKKGKRERGDTSAWTDTPAQRMEKAKQMYLEAYQQASIDAPADFAPRETAETEKTAQLVDEFNSRNRSKTLVDKHQDEMKAKKKKKGKKERNSAEVVDEEWVGNHPWKPWDREKDLVIGPKAISWDKNKQAASLAARFGSDDQGQRHFL